MVSLPSLLEKEGNVSVITDRQAGMYVRDAAASAMPIYTA